MWIFAHFVEQQGIQQQGIKRVWGTLHFTVY